MFLKDLKQAYAKKIICIVGPTATGKSQLAIWLAKNLDGEIINADATQFYQGMNIGTNKVNVEEQKQAIHHLLDIVSPDQNYSVADYQRDGRKIIKTIQDQNKVVIIVGGSGLYINALLQDYQFIDETNQAQALDQAILDRLNSANDQELWDELVNVDPAYATTTHINNKQRVFRALKFYYLHNKTKSAHIAQQNKVDLFPTTYIGLTYADKDVYSKYLYRRIIKHTETGLIEEVRNLYDRYGLIKNLKAISYKELIPYIKEQTTLPKAQLEILKNNLKLAKKQMTWFKGQIRNITWFSNNYYSPFESITDAVKIFLEKNQKNSWQ